MSEEKIELPELDVTEANLDQAMGMMQDNFRVSELAEYLCRERQLLAALKKIAELEAEIERLNAKTKDIQKI